MTLSKLFRVIWYSIKVVLWSPVIILTLLVGMPAMAFYFVGVKKLLTIKEVWHAYRLGIKTGFERDMIYIRLGLHV